jgi:hypothetical protein
VSPGRVHTVHVLLKDLRVLYMRLYLCRLYGISAILTVLTQISFVLGILSNVLCIFEYIRNYLDIKRISPFEIAVFKFAVCFLSGGSFDCGSISEL